MDYFVRNMTEDIAKVVLDWRYEPPYDFYNSVVKEENMVELLEHGYLGVFDENDQVIGFFCTGSAAQVPVGHLHGVYREDFIDIGLGLRPDLTGKGLGYSFLLFILGYLETVFQNKRFRLTVAAFNKRAIHLYKKAGFHPFTEFDTDSGGFLVMVLEMKP
ncbi:acetyltransferase (GNAT) family protein [Bacillus oleivorans]|uniref:Acetyltransferase (GNAT) family protein n=1 Tax=Bacillus oleivorans TaxID=1448271 RepID=A0A285CLR9_9BACI|nr:GNAT family protein [Bacillus oleivorans]SNX68519.1 acetyltransferase (GNAT) family protein [Bacillus oleivorans]